MKLKKLIGKVCHLVANMRAHERKALRGRVAISWRKAGDVVTVFASCRDLSDSGAGIVVDEPFEYGQSVYLRGGVLGDTRTALVRHCRREGDAFHVGFEFTNAPDFAPIWQLKEMELSTEGINW